MTAFAFWKTAHILSAAIIFGTGLGIAFFTWFGYRRAIRSRDVGSLRSVLRLTVIADACLTAPAVAFQAVSGVVLMNHLGWPLVSAWSVVWKDNLSASSGQCGMLRVYDIRRGCATAVRDMGEVSVKNPRRPATSSVELIGEFTAVTTASANQLLLALDQAIAELDANSGFLDSLSDASDLGGDRPSMASLADDSLAEDDLAEGLTRARDLLPDQPDLVGGEAPVLQRAFGESFILRVHRTIILQIDGGASQP